MSEYQTTRAKQYTLKQHREHLYRVLLWAQHSQGKRREYWLEVAEYVRQNINLASDGRVRY